MTASLATVRTVAPGRTRLFALTEMRWAAAALALFLVGLADQLADGPRWSWWALYLACYLCGGWEPGLAGLRALRERTLDVDLLMVAAAIGAAAIGQITDGALLIVIFATSGALEALATARTEDSVRGLLDLTPDTATLITLDKERTVAAIELRIGDRILVRPGERIAADGVVESGASEVDQATITGEPLPVDKSTGDEVFAGTLNGTGALRIRVDRRAQDSVVARIAGLVAEAGRTKARTQLFIEKIEQRYSVGMVVATVALFVVPLVFGESLRISLLRAMTFMIVASPCAVVLATMPPLLAAIANAGRHGVLVKSAVVLERLGEISKIAIDKTGTLTRGTPAVSEIHCLTTDLTESELLRLAAAAEHPSEHPLGAAIVRAARERGLALPEAREFSAQPGRGVTARVDGHILEIGSPAALVSVRNQAVRPLAVLGVSSVICRPATEFPATPVEPTFGDAGALARDLADTVAAVQNSGLTAVVVLCDHRPAGVLAIADLLRPEAATAVAALADSTGSAPVLLTGDNAVTATAVARRVGIADVRAGLLPHDKVAAVRALAADGAAVAMVGDGINDAPALAAAHAGIAMGAAGSDLTLQTADAVVVREDLTAIPAILELSRRARRVVTANLAIAATFIAALVLWDLIGTLPLPLGVAGHEGSTVIVGLNGLRLLRRAAWPRIT
ncbi:heavy metal translocating P-type ATPase [Nocardia alni]|uniref:heavy metal translocating P-type ATPase n=1 Tax=Nocardia alni TaxID=2815723 RepID=UPI001C24D197|nr:heavy metal translocating P-type ATPase [Nocardia alni]